MNGIVISTPIGDITVTADDFAITRVDFGATQVDGVETPVLAEAARQFREYFSGERREFDLPIRFCGTQFQNAVWAAMRDIPLGETRTYAWLAGRTGNPKAARAAGGASHANPLPIIIPCHRVIGANGALTGFGGGIAVKRWLLRHEGAIFESDV